MYTQPDGYERFMGRWSRLLAPLFVDFARLKGCQRILDIGSGTGSMARAIVAADPQVQVLGIDPSQSFIDFASAQAIPRARFQVGDAQHLEFETGSFDACCALLVLNFIPDQQAALAEIRRVVRPGGTLAAAVWDHADGMNMLRIFWEVVDAIDPGERDVEEPRPLLGRDELAARWRGAGFRDVEHAPVTFDMHFASFADYWEPFHFGQGPAGAYLQTAPPPLRTAIECELRTRLLDKGNEAPFTLSARAWAVRGMR